MAKRPPLRSRPAPTSAAENDELDFGDLTLGLVAAVVLPVMVALILGLIGMPVGGSEGLNAEQAELMRATDRYVPPMTPEEARIILDHVQYSVDDRAAEYIRRSRSTVQNPNLISSRGRVVRVTLHIPKGRVNERRTTE